MKKISKRLLALLMAVCMVVVAFAGCQKGDSTTSSATGDASSTGTTSGDSASKWDKEVTLTYYIGNSNPFGKWRQDFIKEKTGVQLEISVADKDKTATMLAGGNLPDIGYYAVDGSLSQAIKGNMLVDMSDKLDKLPNVTKNAKGAIDYYMAEKSEGTGKLYGIPTAIGPADDYAVDTTTYAFNIRWDIYREADYPEVKNYDDALTALKKMLEVHPKAEDGTAMNAFELSAEGDNATSDVPWSNINRWYRMNGVKSVRGFLEYDIRNEKLSPILTKDSQWYTGVKWFWKANQLGLISPESKTQKGSEIGPKLTKGGYTLTATPSSYYRGFNTNERVNAEEPIGIYPLVFEGMYPTVPAVQSVGSVNNPVSISAATKDVDACLRVVDLFYDEDANLTLYNSPQGELWDIVDGKVQATADYTDFYNNSEYTLKNGEVLKTGAFFFSFGLHTDWHHTKYGVTMRQSEWPDAIKLMSDNNLIRLWSEKNGTWNGKKYSYPSEMYKAENMLTWEPAATLFLTPYDDEISITAAAIGEKIATYGWKMVYAKDEAEFNSLFDELVSTCKALDLEKCEKWGQEMWANAEKMADKYATEE